VTIDIICAIETVDVCRCDCQVLLHDQDEIPLMQEHGFKISPGFDTQVAVTAQVVSTIRKFSIDINRATARGDTKGIKRYNVW
jgi:Amiloride-sensitive sodium channel